LVQRGAFTEQVRGRLAARATRFVAVLLVVSVLTAVSAAVASGRTNASSKVAATAQPTPAARVGAFYFDGWSGPLSNFHFGGLLNTPFSGREPLFGWQDASLDSMRTQLAWARQDGVGFFAFDWYYNPDPGNGPINNARDLYLSLHDHDGVGYALNFVNQPGFGVTPSEWPSVVEGWVTHDFVNPDYVRVDGKPLLIIIDEHLFNVQMGGAAGVNAAIATLQDTAHRHGLPGVFVVGGRYLDWNSEHCFPHCLDTDGDFAQEHYDAITEFGYPRILQPVDGPRPYADVAAAIKRTWDVIAQRSPFPQIPGVMSGLDARPEVLAGQVQPAAEGGWPLLNGHETWFTTTADDLAGLVRDAVAWVEAHPSMRVEPSPAPPVVLIESWNELQEGAILLATKENGYSFGQALASALGLPWGTIHRREITAALRRGVLKGTITVADGWTPCAVAAVRLQRRSGTHWQSVAALQTTSAGSFFAVVRGRKATYRLRTPASVRYQQTCTAVTSPALTG
jgi:hypothetical protein